MKKYIIAFFLMLVLLEEPRIGRRPLTVPAAIQATTTLTGKNLALSLMIFQNTIRLRDDSLHRRSGGFDLFSGM